MRRSNFVFMLSALLGCSPKSTTSDEPGNAGAGGSAGAPSNGGAVATGGVAGIPGFGGAGGFSTGGFINPSGSGGAVAGGFTTLPGVNPATQLDQLTGDQLVQACNEFAGYFSMEVPNADIIRGNCVQDAVFNKNATTVPQCQQVSGECIAAAQPIAPIVCAAPMAGFTCPATIALYQQCCNEYTASEKMIYALLVCESLQDPNIQQKIDAALAPSAACTTFTQTCPSFFPIPMTTPDAGP